MSKRAFGRHISRRTTTFPVRKVGATSNNDQEGPRFQVHPSRALVGRRAPIAGQFRATEALRLLSTPHGAREGTTSRRAALLAAAPNVEHLVQWRSDPSNVIRIASKRTSKRKKASAAGHPQESRRSNFLLHSGRCARPAHTTNQLRRGLWSFPQWIEAGQIG